MNNDLSNSDDDTFANIWHFTIREIDEHGNESDVGTNGRTFYLARTPRQRRVMGKAERSRIGEERFDVNMNANLLYTMKLL